MNAIISRCKCDLRAVYGTAQSITIEEFHGEFKWSEFCTHQKITFKTCLKINEFEGILAIQFNTKMCFKLYRAATRRFCSASCTGKMCPSKETLNIERRDQVWSNTSKNEARRSTSISWHVPILPYPEPSEITRYSVSSKISLII